MWVFVFAGEELIMSEKMVKIDAGFKFPKKPKMKDANKGAKKGTKNGSGKK